MACMKLGSKSDIFHRQGQAWFCTSGLPSDVTVKAGEITFHLHKFPLLSKSILLEKLISEQSKADDGCVIKLPDIPGDSKYFELAAKFCYGVKLELTATNVVYLRCTAEYLQMTEEIAEGNLISQTETFISQVVLRSWKDSLKALQTCENLVPYAENLNIVKRCIESLVFMASKDPTAFGLPIMEHGSMQSPGGSVLWNGIRTGARPRSCSSNWWYDDITSLNLSTYKCLISVMLSRGIGIESIAGSLTSYAKRYIHGLNNRQNTAPVALASATSEDDQRYLLEEIESLLPSQKGVISTKFLCNLLRTALILKARHSSVSNLERRIGLQLDEATLDDLLMPTFAYSMEALYDVDCIQRILEHFLAMDQASGGASPCPVDDEHLIGSVSLTASTNVAKLIDGFLAEIASDVNLKLPKILSLAAVVPEYARPLDDGLYRAIDIYLKAHPWISESEREQLCRIMDCQKLSLDACTHAAQNERLPIRVIVQVLYFEQLQLRTSIAGCFLVSDNLDGSRPLRSGLVAPSDGGGWITSVGENQVVKVGMDHMRTRVSDLEKECSTIWQEIERLGQGRRGWTKKFGFKLNSKMCSSKDDSVSGHNRSITEKMERIPVNHPKHKRNLLFDK